jgi:hypothetical protein
MRRWEIRNRFQQPIRECLWGSVLRLKAQSGQGLGICRSDEPEAGEIRERGVGRNQSFCPGQQGAGRQNGVEGSQPVACPVQPQALLKLSPAGRQKGREELDVGNAQVAGILAGAPAGSDVDELLDCLDGGGCLDFGRGHRLHD